MSIIPPEGKLDLIQNQNLLKYKQAMFAIKVGQFIIIPWHEFESGGVREKQKVIKSRGEPPIKWLLTAKEYGLEVKRLE